MGVGAKKRKKAQKFSAIELMESLRTHLKTFSVHFNFMLLIEQAKHKKKHQERSERNKKDFSFRSGPQLNTMRGE